MNTRTLVVACTVGLLAPTSFAARDNSIANTPPSRESITNTFPPPAATPQPCPRAAAGPAVAGCLALGGLTPEVRALNRLACLLEGVERWKLTALACAQRQVDEWQETVIWPRNVLDSLRGAALARVKTLREQYEEMVEDWSMPTATQSLASIYGAPKIVARQEYEHVWGRARGPSSDIAELTSWLSVANRNTIQGRTSAAFGLAGELPENTWERIGREGSRVLAESRRDPLSAIRHTPQMLADRTRVDSNTLRMQAQTLITRQVHRDFKRYQRRRAQALGDVWLRMLAGPYAHDTPTPTPGVTTTRAETRS